MAVTNVQELDLLVARVKKAQQVFATYTQEQVDEIFRCAALAAADARIPLARMAVTETGMGVLEDKVIKKPLRLRIYLQRLQRRENLRCARSRCRFWHHDHRRTDRHYLRHCADHQSHLNRHFQGVDFA